MSHNGVEGPRETPPHRARHQISRSISELSSPIRLHRHHSHHRAKEKEKERERDGRATAPQAAAMVQQGRSSLDGSRSDGVTPSPDPSRRTSILLASEDAQTAMAGTTAANGPAATKAQLEAALLKERQMVIARESGLRKTMAQLEEFSVAATNQLGDKYNSVSEKLAMLKTTIVALKELAGLSNQMNTTFAADAEDLVADITSQLDGFGQFEDQQARIEKLQSRISAGRDKIKVLSKRVDVVRERIENWERADKEWQERTRKRLKVVWVVTSILAFVFLLLFLSAQYAPESLEQPVRLANNSLNTLRNVTSSNALWAEPKDDFGGRDGRDEGSPKGTVATEPPSSSSDVLRVFDEL
ncbi:hypothetical protein QBC34DRAFT_52279 [Podospora aff. communis PSN243]|uniref:Uncharacterized protein n=1 Tax=Podospora aff. communis PSN243 TaxID=3040156 RepID=A0AAV9GTY5_9PEZI|nr:hypothetical protein QBC34DRAFT_52279 [Podospora aff. communis PSN243]